LGFEAKTPQGRIEISTVRRNPRALAKCKIEAIYADFPAIHCLSSTAFVNGFRQPRLGGAPGFPTGNGHGRKGSAPSQGCRMTPSHAKTEMAMPNRTIALGGLLDELDKQRRILWALLMRELSTRYGRDNLGFLWIVGEPMIFAGCVSVMWSQIRTPFENGIPIVPFIITGYLPLILVRQTVNFSVTAVKVNASLLYHRQLTPLHLFVARFTIEFIGVSAALVIIVAIANVLGLMGLPKNFGLALEGWCLLSWISFGMALIMGALAEIFEAIERVVQIVTYIYIPFSGAFLMASTMTPKFRTAVEFLPFIHCNEMFRSGYFGEFIVVYYNADYAMTWAAGLTLIGLFIVQFVRSRVEVL
jgi:capsular polysaccharide transport system permease protein